ncbi:MAG: hypothetical protein SNJ74_12260, partial [Fimbriimonadaceae bacterium]
MCFARRVGVPLGNDPEELGLQRQIVPAIPLLEEEGVLPKRGVGGAAKPGGRRKRAEGHRGGGATIDAS